MAYGMYLPSGYPAFVQAYPALQPAPAFQPVIDWAGLGGMTANPQVATVQDYPGFGQSPLTSRAIPDPSDPNFLALSGQNWLSFVSQVQGLNNARPQVDDEGKVVRYPGWTDYTGPSSRFQPAQTRQAWGGR